MAHLVVTQAPAAGRQVGEVLPLDDEHTVLGRDPKFAEAGEGYILVSTYAPSRRHAVITRTPSGYVVRDLSSRLGTRVNSAPLGLGGQVALADGDAIEVCGSVFTFRTG